MASQVRLLAYLAVYSCACAVPRAHAYIGFGGNRVVLLEDNPESNVRLHDSTEETLRAREIPVNEKYPHAVLFGGTCGGTIIHPKWVLSAAHCTLFTAGKYVLAGTNNSMDGSGVRQRVKQLYVHPRFSVGPYWLNARRYNIKQVAARFDFLLAELEDPLPIDNKTIAVAKLNDVAELRSNIKVGYAGYGAEHHGETMRHEMHGMDLLLLSDDKCGVLEEFDSQDMICIQGYAPKYDSACNGDSGSGVVDERGVLVGIASWVQNDAIECRNSAVVYCSKVSAALDWIHKVTRI